MDPKKSVFNALENSEAYSDRHIGYSRRNFSPIDTIHKSSFVDDRSQHPNTLSRVKSNGNDVFQGQVPVRVRNQLDHDRDSLLNIKIYEDMSSGSTYQIFRLTDDKDLQFMKILELNEQKFARLKSEQRLQMGFSQFADKFVDLIKRCNSVHSTYRASFECILDLSHEEPAFFKIIEKNEFKELDHLVLEFNQPSDKKIKSYLADCLNIARTDEKIFNNTIRGLETEVNSLTDLATTRQDKIEVMTRDHNTTRQNLIEQYEDQIKQLLENHEKVVSDYKEKIASVEFRLTSKYTEREKLLENQLDTMENKYREEKERANILSENVFQLSGQKDILQSQLEAAENRIKQLQSNLEISQDKIMSIESDNMQLRNQIKFHEHSINEREEVNRQIQDKLQLYKDSVAKSEVSIEELRKSVAKYEKKLTESSAEILKANDLLENMQNEIEKRKTTAKNLKTIITKQESMINDLQNTHKSLFKDKERLVKDIEDREDKLKQKESETQNLKSMVSDLERSIKDKQDMIDYLNKRLTEDDRSNKIHKYHNPIITDSYSNRMSHTGQRMMSERNEGINLTKTYKYKSELDSDKDRVDSIYKTKYGDGFPGISIQDKYDTKPDLISNDFARFDIKKINSTYEPDVLQSDTRLLTTLSGLEKKEEVDFPIPRPITRVPFNPNKKS